MKDNPCVPQRFFEKITKVAPNIYELLSNELGPQTRDSSQIVLYQYFHHELIVQIFPYIFQTGNHQPELQQPYDEYLYIR